jgi:hypothetical protein
MRGSVLPGQWVQANDFNSSDRFTIAQSPVTGLLYLFICGEDQRECGCLSLINCQYEQIRSIYLKLEIIRCNKLP